MQPHFPHSSSISLTVFEEVVAASAVAASAVAASTVTVAVAALV